VGKYEYVFQALQLVSISHDFRNLIILNILDGNIMVQDFFLWNISYFFVLPFYRRSKYFLENYILVYLENLVPFMQSLYPTYMKSGIICYFVYS
jgi:hypothetical protein